MPPTHLLLFDIDGTLLTVDEERSFADAFREFTGHTPVMEWERYRSTTDWGVAIEILEENLGRPPADHEVQRVLDLFVAHLRRNIAEGATPLVPAPGAQEFVRRAAAAGCALALATGCVFASARHKVDCLGLGDLLTCGGYGERRFDRVALLRDAIAAAEAKHGVRFPPECICYFGDRRWDAEGARALGLHFVGVALKPAARERLAAAGVQRIIADYAELADPLDSFSSPVAP